MNSMIFVRSQLAARANGNSCKDVMMGTIRGLSMLGLLVFAALSGCSQEKPPIAESGRKTGDAAPKTEVAVAKADDHSGWWCNEHGVPEGICAQCSSKVAADFQKKGDWCKQHDRPESQCFICHPELEAKFAAQYEAKYGKKPPKPESD